MPARHLSWNMTLPVRQSDRAALEQLDDAELVRRICAGDSALFELVMRRHNPRLFRIVRTMLRNDAEAEDALQEAYVSAYFKLHQFRGPAGFAGWLRRIATNEALMRRRSSISKSWIQPAMDSDEDKRPPAQSPEEQLHELQMTQLLQRAVEELPDVYRDAFVLREIEQLSVAEVAQLLNVEAATVKTRVHRARRMMQRDITGELRSALRNIYQFDGARCDRIVADVFKRIQTA